MMLAPSPVSSNKFFFNKSSGTFIAEASDLQGFRLGRVYDDACDEGFSIVSEKTGKSAVFALADEIFRNEDIGGWNFVCVTPGLKQLKAVIFND